MKYFTHPARCSLVVLLLCLLPVSAGYAQDSNQCESYDVEVDMWTLPKTTNSQFPLPDIRDQFLTITDAVLDHVNEATSFDASDAASHLDASNSSAIINQMNSIRDDYCVRRGEFKPNDPTKNRVYPYTALVLPILTKPYHYEVRGLHLLSKESGSENRPQLVLKFEIVSRDNGQNPLENPNVVLTGVEVNNIQDYSIGDVNTSSSRIEQVRDLIERFANAYNAETTDEIMSNLREVLNDAVLDEGQVEIFESSNRKNAAGVYEQKIGPQKNARTYLSQVEGRLNRYGVTEIAFEVIDVYRLPYESIEKYRATVLQHYMYEKAFQSSQSETYMDSDYLAIDVVFNADNKPVITLRRAGRGTFLVDSAPSGADITSVNGFDLSAYDVKTPLDYLLNAPLQWHRVTIDNVWYSQVDTTISTPRTAPEDENGEEVLVELKHKDAYLVLNVRPADRADALRYNIGGGEQPIEVGNSITITPSELSGVPLPEERIESNNRWVDLTVTAPVFDNFEVQSDTVNWSRPDTREVTIDFPKGNIEISSTPDASTARITDPGGATVEETTLASMEAYATLPGEGLSVQVSNGRCYQDDPEIDECRFHIPSEVQSGIMIRPNELKRVHVDLNPFLVRDETNAGNISGVSLTRDDQLLTVSYTIEDNKDRDRKFILDFDMFDRNSGEKLADLDNQVRSCSSSTSNGQDSTTDPDAFECIGNGVLPGTHYYTWDMSDWGLDSSDNYLPVLSMRRKGTCLPCILIPVAAGAAAAIIFPRTGSNEVPTFVPPPRPTETQNR